MAEKKITEAAVLNLLREDKVSISKGAGLLGISVQEFLDLMYKNGLTDWDDKPEEIGKGYIKRYYGEQVRR